MSKPMETIQTVHGRLDSVNLQKILDSYDTQGLLTAIDELDKLVNEVRGEGGLRDMLLRLHAMAHTVINGAPMAVSGDQESLPELATEVAMQLHEAVSLLQQWTRRIEPLESLMAED